MNRAALHEGLRRMRFSSLLERHERGEISQCEAASMLGVHERTFRRWQGRFETDGEAGLADRRLGQASPKRAPLIEIERMLGLFRDKYADFTVKHFHEQLVKRVSTLAPGIVEAILEGRQPLGLSARGLMRMSHALPLDWTAQRKFLGFAAV